MQNSNIINLWTSINRCQTYWEYRLRSTTNQWMGSDNLENYEKAIKDNIQTYSDTDFDYKFNSLGYRSDEYDNDCSPKILYAGCSISEGIGLPQNHIYSAFINERISAEIGKPVPFFNISRGGSSIDTIIRMTYNLIQHHSFIPDLVYFLLPPVTRGEVIYEQPNLNEAAIYNFIPNFPPANDSPYEVKELHKQLVLSINYRNRYNDAFRNLLLMKYFLESKGIKWFFSFWYDDLDKMIIEPVLNMTRNLDISIPKEIENNYIPKNMGAGSHVTAPIFPQKIARDAAHFGPNKHYFFSKLVFDELKNKQEFIELLEKWKN